MTKDYENIICPKCLFIMGWAGFSEDTPHIIEYHCDECGWKGDYNWEIGEFDEYTQEDYYNIISLDEALNQVEELGGEIKYYFDFEDYENED